MAGKTTTTRQEKTFDLVLDHADLVDMMNDPEVLLDGGTVSEDQSFQLVLRKSSGAESILKDMSATDTLVVRFKKVTITTVTGDLDGVDVQ